MEFNFGQLFDQFDTADSYAILLMLFIAFLFGLLAGLLLRGGAVRRLRRERDEARRQLEAQVKTAAEAQEQLTAASEELAARENFAKKMRADAEAARAEAQRLEQDNRRLEQEKHHLYSEVRAINDELEQLQVSNQSYLTTIDELNRQILQLREQYEQPREMAAAPVAPVARGELGLNDRLAAIENKMLQLESENIALKQELDDLKTHAYPPAAARSAPEPALRDPAELDQPQQRFAAAAPAAGRDDLTLIRGIGPFIEQRLNTIGIFTYDQIAGWEDDQVEAVTRELEYFEGRIRNDDWVGQARRLWQLKRDDPAALQALAGNPRDPHNLKVVEGVGPQIEELLKAAGFQTWEDLANASVDALETILRNGGDRYRLHDPTTWPIQARLAVNGDWDLLADYQEQLKGGRE